MTEPQAEWIVSELSQNPLWQKHVLGRKWVCPFCGQLGAPWKDGQSEAMADAVWDHLDTECMAFKGKDDSQPMPEDELEKKRFTHEAKHRLRHDDAWRLKDREGNWFCPYTAKFTDIRIRDDEPLTREKFSQVVEYVLALSEYKDGNEPLAYPYLRAKLLFFTHPSYRVTSAEGKWINPYTGAVTPVDFNLEARGEEDLFTDIWKELEATPDFADGQGQIRTVNELQKGSSTSAERMDTLTQSVTDHFQQNPQWQHFSPQGLWICPLCSETVSGVKHPSEGRVSLRLSSGKIAKHLLSHCPVFMEKSKDLADADVASVLGPIPMGMAAGGQAFPGGGQPGSNPGQAGGQGEFVIEAVPIAPVDNSFNPFAQPAVPDGGGQPGAFPNAPAQGGGGFPQYGSVPFPGQGGGFPGGVAEAQAVPQAPLGGPDDNRQLIDNLNKGISQIMDANQSNRAHELQDRAFEEARRKQLRMLPEPPEVEGIECAVVYKPCDMVGGDFYDFLVFADAKLGIVQGDVSGHGMEVWGDMTMAMKVMRIYAKQSKSAAEMMKNANDDLVPDLMAKTFVSAYYSILDTETFKMQMARAGHNPLIVYNPDRKPKPLIQYEPKGMVLGMARGAMFNNVLEEVEIQLYSGDQLLWYTDGVTEAMNPEGDEYGLERLCAVIEQHGHLGAEELLQAILDNIDEFRGEAAPDDDVTLIAVKVL